MANIKPPQSAKELPLAVIKNIITLATSGFGVVVALAWNEVIKKTVDDYINPYLGKGSGLASLFIYAILMTVLAVLITMQLSGIQRTMELWHEKKLGSAGKKESSSSPSAH